MKSFSTYPLVSVGIPTYNRASSLKRAINSVLEQDYSNIEIAISDNASTDDTEKICKEYVEKNNKVRYFRRNYNLGAVANFAEVLKRSNGEYFMWLADDDWIGRSYISECIRILVKRPKYSLVYGRVKCFEDDIICDGIVPVKMKLPEELGEKRLISYFAQVVDNSVIYGLMRRDQVSRIEWRNVYGGDMLVAAAIAFLGKIESIDNVTLFRTVNKYGSCPKAYYIEMTKSLRINSFYAKFPYQSVAFYNFIEILYRSNVYKELNFISRLNLAFHSSKLIVERFILCFYPKTQRIILMISFFLNLPKKLISLIKN